MIGKMVDASLPQAAPKTGETIFGTAPTFYRSKVSIVVEIHFDTAMSVAHPRRRNSCDDVIVVNPSIVSQVAVVDVAFVANARTAERENPFGVGGDM